MSDRDLKKCSADKMSGFTMSLNIHEERSVGGGTVGRGVLRYIQSYGSVTEW